MRSLLLNSMLLSTVVILFSATSLFSQNHEITPQTNETVPTSYEVVAEIPPTTPPQDQEEALEEMSEQALLLAQMFDAVAEGEAETVKAMIDEGKVDYYRHNDTGETALTQAIVNDDIELVKLLVKEAIINLKNEEGETPLTLAIKNANMDIIPLVMKRAKASLKNDAGEAPLFLALQSGDLHLLHQLIRNGADVNRTSNGITPLAQAVLLDNYRAVGYLVRNGAMVNQANDNGDIPLYLAIENGYDVLAGILISKTPDAFNDVNWRSPIGDPLLNIAAAQGNTEIIRMLIEAGASVNDVDHEENTPLHIAAANANHDAITLMMTYDADINFRNLLGATPLMTAAANSHQSTYDLLVEYGANTEIKDYIGHIAADYFNNKSGSTTENSANNIANGYKK